MDEDGFLVVPEALDREMVSPRERGGQPAGTCVPEQATVVVDR